MTGTWAARDHCGLLQLRAAYMRPIKFDGGRAVDPGLSLGFNFWLDFGAALGMTLGSPFGSHLGTTLGPDLTFH